MTTAIVALNPDLGPPAPFPAPRLDRQDLADRIDMLAIDALVGGHVMGYILLERVAIALRGARAVELATEILLFLEREQLLDVIHEPGGWVRPRDFLDDLSPTGVFDVIDAEDDGTEGTGGER